MEQQILEFLRNFSSIIWEAFPFIVLGAVISGILEEIVPQQAITRFIPKNKILAVSLGCLLGLVFPMCECGIVPVMRRLLRKGLPLGTCIAYMMAGPIINVVVIGSTLIAFGPHNLALPVTGLRVGLGFIVALITGLLVNRMYKKHGNSLLAPLARPHQDAGTSAKAGEEAANQPSSQNRSLMTRLGNISETALHDFKDIMVFLMLGSIIASLSKFWISPAQLKDLSSNYPSLSIVSMMGLAILMCLCSEADAFVAASFKTLHLSAKIAFLVLGPMFDLKLLMMFTRVFRKKLIILIVLSAVVQVYIYSMIVEFLDTSHPTLFVDKVEDNSSADDFKE